MQRPCPIVAVVGAGFCGTMAAVHLARAGELAVVLIERSGRFGAGVAYGAARPFHLLNTPAGRMSALPGDGEHFTRWAHTRDPAVHGGSFLPRTQYAEYLGEMLTALRPTTCPPGQVNTDRPGLTCLTGQVIDVTEDGLRLTDATMSADAIVLCPGSPPPATIAALPEALRGHPAHIADPWDFDATRLDLDAPAVLLGSGLTALDVVLTLVEAGHRGPIHVISRRGLLPQPHRGSARPGQLAPPDIEAWPATARGVLAGMRGAVRDAEARGIDWREVVASLRPVTARLWQRLPLAEQAGFLAHVRPYWDSHRHRAAPATHEAFAALRASGRVQVHAGRVLGVRADGPRLRIEVEHGGIRRAHSVGALIHCTGPASDLRATQDPLLRALLARGVAQVDPLGLGLVTDDDGRLPASSRPPIYLAGALRRPALWESTAVLELAEQVASLTTTLRARVR